jgi:hypothetical protein
MRVSGQPNTAAVFSDYRNSPDQHVDHVDAFADCEQGFITYGPPVGQGRGRTCLARDAASKAVGVALPGSTTAEAA